MLVKLAWRNLWRNKLRTSIIIGAMIFGLTGVIAMMGFMTGFVDSLVSNAIRWQTSHIQVHNKAYLLNPDISAQIPAANELINEIRQIPSVDVVSERFLVDGMIASSRSNRAVRFNGVELDSEAKITPLSQHITKGEWLDQQGRNPILVSEKLAERLNLRVGSKVVLTFTDANGQVAGAAYRVRGLFKTPSTTFDDRNVFVRKADLQRTAQMEGVHEIAVLLKDASEIRNTIEQLNDMVSKAPWQGVVTVRDWQKIQPMLATMMSTMDVSNQVILIIFVIAMMFGIINIMLMSVYERTQEFGVLMAVGMQKHKIFVLLILETSMLGAAGALLGIFLSSVIIKALNHFGISLAAMSDGLGAYGVDTLLRPRVSLEEYVMVLFIVVAASFIAAIYPARQILKQRPVDAMAEKR
tara:strand:+ start:748 stop:1980 length:1233 start_codon:yes stop_codon:yes gene_type:complete